jgi:hypothetical protein
MKRTTIFIPESLERDLQLYARRERKPAASIVREAIAAYIVRGGHGSSLPSFAGAFDSGRTDTADRHEELLFKALTTDGSKPSRPKRARAPRRLTLRPTRKS